MNDIKIKRKGIEKIKKLDKTKMYTKKLKNNFTNIKDKSTYNSNEENSATEYGGNRISENINIIFHNSTNKFDEFGKKSLKETSKNIINAKEFIKKKLSNNNIKNKSIEITQNFTNKNPKMIKTAKYAERTTYKTAKKTTETSVKGAKKAYQIAKSTAKTSYESIKKVVKATISTIKAIIASTKALIAFLIAGGWIAIIIIIIISLISLLCSSFLGIFFSSEKNVGEKTMSSIISEINMEFTNKITEIQNNNPHDEFEIHSNRAEWKDILSIYVATTSNGEDGVNVLTLDDDKINHLKKIFWEMNIINSRIDVVEREIEITDDKGNITKQKVKRNLLYIDITSKTIDEMIEQYKLNSKQIMQISELQKEEYSDLWTNVVYGSSNGSTDIVQVALSQVGNVGGEPYWSWYGFTSRVEWCACFVSYCANECGYIEAGIIPKFASCESEGVSWFKACQLWKERGYIPKPGDIIFFDWEESQDGQADHVGIVEKSENGKVYTIEGNSNNDTCRQKEYDINSTVILGYGTPLY